MCGADVGRECETAVAMTDVALLEREMCAEAEAARLLNVAQSTLHYWLEGKTGCAGKVHCPVIREEPKGTGAAVTWAEFVEAGDVQYSWCHHAAGGCVPTRLA
jgi:hypothetical protein